MNRHVSRITVGMFVRLALQIISGALREFPVRISIMPVSIVLLLFPLIVCAGEESISGEKLFHSTSLGTTGKSCSTCHPQGKGLEQSGDYDDAILREFVNFCIRDAMKGKMLPEGSEELRTLGSYLRVFRSPNKVVYLSRLCWV